MFLSRKIRKQSTGYLRPVSSQLVLPPRDVLWAVGFCRTSASLTPFPPFNTARPKSPLHYCCHLKQGNKPVCPTLCCACPHRTRVGRDSSGCTVIPTTEWLPLVPCPVCYLEAEPAGPFRSVVGVSRILPQLLPCSAAVCLLLWTGQPHASRAKFLSLFLCVAFFFLFKIFHL